MAAPRSYFHRIEQFTLPSALIPATVDWLRKEGQFRVESIAYWAGSIGVQGARITDLIVPSGPGVQRHPLQVRVSDRTMASICALVEPPDRVLLVQVHTHRGEAFHSDTDDQYSLNTPGLVSIVIPHFAKEGGERWNQWGFHECIDHAVFRRMSTAEVSERFLIESNMEFNTHVISST